jgi:hypothetical protein
LDRAAAAAAAAEAVAVAAETDIVAAETDIAAAVMVVEEVEPAATMPGTGMGVPHLAVTVAAVRAEIGMPRRRQGAVVEIATAMTVMDTTSTVTETVEVELPRSVTIAMEVVQEEEAEAEDTQVDARAGEGGMILIEVVVAIPIAEMLLRRGLTALVIPGAMVEEVGMGVAGADIVRQGAVVVEAQEIILTATELLRLMLGAEMVLFSDVTPARRRRAAGAPLEGHGLRHRRDTVELLHVAVVQTRTPPHRARKRTR